MILLLILVLLVPVVAFAGIGVGVGIGKIEVTEPLKAGQIHILPSLPVLNTVDEPGEYGVSVEYHEGVPQLRPVREWFLFNPSSFYLEPGEVKNVEVILTLPLKARPGDYFCYLEGHPIQKAEAGVTRVGVAAAAKLYFTVAPANIWQGIYYRISSLWTIYSPWTWVALAVVLAAIFIAIFRKYFAFQVGIRKK